MLVKELIKLLESMDPDVPVVTRTGKYSFGPLNHVDAGFYNKSVGSFDPDVDGEGKTNSVYVGD